MAGVLIQKNTARRMRTAFCQSHKKKVKLDCHFLVLLKYRANKNVIDLLKLLRGGI